MLLSLLLTQHLPYLFLLTVRNHPQLINQLLPFSFSDHWLFWLQNEAKDATMASFFINKAMTFLQEQEVYSKIKLYEVQCKLK